MANENYTHKSFSEVLGALGPGGRVLVTFEEYSGLFGHEPTEDEIEGQRAHRFAKDNGCRQEVDHTTKQVLFHKSASDAAPSQRQSDPTPGRR